MKKQLLGFVVAPLALTLAIDVSPAKAVLTYNIYESLGNLVVETSGSLNLTPASPGLICGFNGALVSSVAGICTGTPVLGRPYTISGPSSFPGTAVLARYPWLESVPPSGSAVACASAFIGARPRPTPERIALVLSAAES